jgi:hypothetical protein
MTLTRPGQPRSTRPPSSALLKASLDQLETAIGGRAVLQAALEQAPPSKDLTFVINAIADPTNDVRDLASICAEHQVTVGELLQAYKMGALAEAQALSVASISQQVPKVTADVMRRAAPHNEPCPACLGDPNKVGECTTCKGAGELTYLPEFVRQKLALELAGLVGPKGGIAINVTQANQQVSAAVAGEAGALARLHAATDQVLHRTPITAEELADAEAEAAAEAAMDTVDAEVVEAPADTAADGEVAND